MTAAGSPSKVTETSPRVWGQGSVIAVTGAAARSVPVIVAIDPGASADEIVRLKVAPLVMPPAEIVGVCAWADRTSRPGSRVERVGFSMDALIGDQDAGGVVRGSNFPSREL